MDLSSFYDVIKGRGVAEVDKALDEFYLRVVVGSLTRANKHYVSWNPSRQKIFLKLIEELRKHIMIIRGADRVREEAEIASWERSRVLQALGKSDAANLWVGGRLGEEVTIRVQLLRGLDQTSSQGSEPCLRPPGPSTRRIGQF